MKHSLIFILTVVLFLSTHAARTAEFVDLTDHVGDGVAPVSSVSADGRFVAGRTTVETALEYEAFIWSRESGVRKLGALPGHNESEATDVSGDGSVVVGYSDD